MAKDMHVQGPQINQFNNIAPQPIPRSSFKRDFTYRTTFNQDFLIPHFLEEVLPGDDINLKMTAFVRMATPIKPLMDNLYLETFWFFIPNRLVWDNWEKLQGERVNPADSVAYSTPVLDKTKAPLSTTGFLQETIYDYFGLPTLVSGVADIQSMWNRAYDLIWNEWFRDENLQNSIVVPTGDGPDDPALYTLRKRNKRKDYFTSGLPWPQKGDAVTISLGSIAPILRVSNSGAGIWKKEGTDAANFAGAASFFLTPSGNSVLRSAGDGANVSYDPNGSLVADLASANPITINALRQAALYQQILELDARGGTRYVEGIFSRFGVVSPDFRLQRPELIGQGSTRINIYSVPQTAPTESGTTPQGNLAAFGTAHVNSHGCRYSSTEHGMVIGLLNVRADLTYQQGLPRMFTRRTRLDFYEPLLNGLGEQGIFNREIYTQGSAGGGVPDLTIFAYQERFADYRFRNSMITGKFRSTATGTLDIWHLGQKFAALPVLNSSFITEAVPMARVLAVNTEPSFLMDASFDYTHVRPMPIRSNPGITRL